MPIDAVIQAQMTDLMVRKGRAEQELAQVRVDGPVWKKRVELARAKAMEELAEQAEEKLEALRQRSRELKLELEEIDRERDALRYQAKRPSGEEVRRARAMVEQVRQGGLIDPDRAGLERELEELTRLDFGPSKDQEEEP